MKQRISVEVYFHQPMKYIQTSKLKRIFCRKKPNLRELNSNPNGEENEEPSQLSHRRIWKSFSFREILVATNGFSTENLVGKGGHAEVYRGILRDGEEIAVKRLLKTCNVERRAREFLTEIGTMGHANHPNILSLLGCCVDNGLHLIFQFSSKGSVSSLLHDGGEMAPMEWKIRYRIAIGTARGLNYLHEECQRRIIHRDIKSSNILLTSDYEPLISDFGLAKWLPPQCSHYSIAPIEGTFGYLAPEYYMHGIVDEKTDVFAYGIFLLELLSGRKPADGSHQSLHSWAKPRLKEESEYEKLVDKRLKMDYDVRQVKRVAFAASLCIRSSSMRRPTMSQVLEIMQQENTDKERWRMQEEEDDELWSFKNLVYESDTSFSTTPHNSILNTTILPEFVN